MKLSDFSPRPEFLLFAAFINGMFGILAAVAISNDVPVAPWVCLFFALVLITLMWSQDARDARDARVMCERVATERSRDAARRAARREADAARREAAARHARQVAYVEHVDKLRAEYARAAAAWKDARRNSSYRTCARYTAGDWKVRVYELGVDTDTAPRFFAAAHNVVSGETRLTDTPASRAEFVTIDTALKIMVPSSDWKLDYILNN